MMDGMSKGASKVVPVRIPAHILAAMTAAIERSNLKGKGQPMTQSSFIISAVIEKLAHMDRAAGRPGVSVVQLRAAEQHRLRDADSGQGWTCECEACQAVRSQVKGEGDE